MDHKWITSLPFKVIRVVLPQKHSAGYFPKHDIKFNEPSTKVSIALKSCKNNRITENCN